MNYNRGEGGGGGCDFTQFVVHEIGGCILYL